MTPAKKLKQRMLTDEPTLGVIVTYHLWLDVIEIVQASGLDYLLIDAEHLSHSAELIADCCAFARRMDFPILLRPPRTDAESIRQAMDLGPCGFLLPMIETAQQLDDVQRGAYMPPRGERRPGGRSNRWLTGINSENIRSEIEDDLIIIPQIESAAGVANADAIIAHPLTTALGVGPYDLSARLGCCWNPSDPRLVETLRTLHDKARAANKRMWTVGQPRPLLELGYRFFCVGEVSMWLESTLKQCVADLRRQHNCGVRPQSTP